MLLNFIKKIDLYGSPYSFTVFKNTTYNTVIGGIITILTVLLYVFCFYYFGKDFYMRKNPGFLNQITTLKNYVNYTLFKDDLLLAFRVEDLDGNLFDITGLLYFESVYIGYETIDNQFIQSSHKPMEIINCTQINLTTMRLTTKKDLSEMQCINFNNTNLGGYWDGDFLYYITIKLKPCINSTSNNNSCLYYDEAYSILNSGNLTLNMYTNRHYTELDDYQNPLKLTLFNSYGNLDPNLGKLMRLFFKTTSIKTDLGIISDKSNSYSVYSLHSATSDTIPIDPPLKNASNNSFIGEFEIYLLNNIETYEVTYIKLQQIIAYIGGFLSFISTFFNIITSLLNEHYRSIEIINKLFDFNALKDKEKLNFLIEEQKKESLSDSFKINQGTIIKINRNNPKFYLNTNIDNQEPNEIKLSYKNTLGKLSFKI